jgi:hypothetical protein
MARKNHGSGNGPGQDWRIAEDDITAHGLGAAFGGDEGGVGRPADVGDLAGAVVGRLAYEEALACPMRSRKNFEHFGVAVARGAFEHANLLVEERPHLMIRSTIVSLRRLL